MTDVRLALLHSDGSLTVLAPATRAVEALKHRDDLADWEPEAAPRLVRVAVEIVEDVVVEELADG